MKRPGFPGRFFLRGRLKRTLVPVMRDHHKKNIESYNRDARALTEVYNGLSSEDVLPGLAERLPPSTRSKRRRVLELGCGSGRDAFWLAHEKGFEVVAVDASASMLAYAEKYKKHPRVRYVEDMLPEITKVMDTARKTHEKFDVFVMSAVWMHLQPDERAVLMENIAKLASPKALVYISLRHGTAPADRPMFENSAAEIKALGRKYGAQWEVVGADRDRQGRAGVKWEYVALKF